MPLSFVQGMGSEFDQYCFQFRINLSYICHLQIKEEIHCIVYGRLLVALVFIFTTVLLGFRFFGSINEGSVVSGSERLLLLYRLREATVRFTS